MYEAPYVVFVPVFSSKMKSVFGNVLVYFDDMIIFVDAGKMYLDMNI